MAFYSNGSLYVDTLRALWHQALLSNSEPVAKRIRVQNSTSSVQTM